MTDFKIGDTVRFGYSGTLHVVSDLTPEGTTYPYVYLDGLKNDSGQGQCATTLVLVERPEDTLSQAWQDKIEAALGRDALVTLGVVKPAKVKKSAIQVQFHLDGTGADYVRRRIADIIRDDTGFDLRGEVTAHAYTYTEDEEV